jgi:glycerophosphoryl diester phosphodiesterase
MKIPFNNGKQSTGNRAAAVLVLSLIAVGVFFVHTASTQQTMHVLKIETVEELHDFFRYTGSDVPLVSGHRGGIVPGYPENSIAAMENTLRHTPAYFEVDPRITKDSVIVLMHDVTLDRTTTGTGNVSDYTWKELQELRLVDHLGNETDYRIPSLAEAIEWSRGKTVINLDKKDVPLEMTAAIIREHQAQAHVMLTVHSAAEARFYLDQNPNSMFSAFIRNEQEFADYKNEGIPWGQMIAYVGPRILPENRELYEMLNERGVKVMIGAAPSYDHLESFEERKAAYQALLDGGIDIIESDLPIDVAKAIQSSIPPDSPKQKYFGTIQSY